MNVNYYNYRENRPATTYNKITYFLFTPYVIAKIGPVDLQAEFNYLTGDQKYEDAFNHSRYRPSKYQWLG
ncbi:MAG: hypothetical protein MZV70_14665 [Desulfobacterales bacterium]|nr:hypothetical protein [Desulfobacterales bacterium]